MFKEYPNHMLDQVIFQIKFYPLLKLYSDAPEVASDFQQVVINEFPELNIKQSRKVSLKLGSTGLPVGGEANKPHLIWNFKNDNGKFINLSGDDLSLTYPGNVYTTFKPFLEDIKLALSGLKLYNLPKIKSIGLRYINQIDLEDDSNLDGFINPKLHLLSSDSDNENVIQSISRIEYNIDKFFLSFQYGLFNPKYPEYDSKKDFILDYDCILNGAPADNLEDCLNEMNNIIYTKFESSIGDKLRIKMGGKLYDK